MNEEVMTENVEDAVPAGTGITQETLNKVVQERLTRQRAQYEKQIADLQAEKATELSKAAEDAQNAAARAAQLETNLRQQAVMTAALRNGANETAAEQISKLVDLSDLTDGDSSAIGEKVAAFVAENPHFVTSQNMKPVVPAVAGNSAKSDEVTITPDALAGMTPQQLAANPELFEQVINARNNW